MRKNIKYLYLIMILLGLNFLSFILDFMVMELSYKIDEVMYYSVIPLFIIFTILLEKYIRKNSLDIIISLTLIYAVLLIIRCGEVYISYRLGFAWCSLGIVQVAHDLFSSNGEEYFYWWSVPIFPLVQPICIFIINRIRICKQNKC